LLWVVRALRRALRVRELSLCRPQSIVNVAEGYLMDEQQMQMAAMEAMMGGGMEGGMSDDPFATEAPPGYSMVMVPDAILPAVMELVSQVEGGGGQPGMGGGMPPMM
jgi:hypothetical protein